MTILRKMCCLCRQDLNKLKSLWEIIVVELLKGDWHAAALLRTANASNSLAIRMGNNLAM